VNLIEVEDDTGHGRDGAVLGGPNAEQAKRIDCDLIGSTPRADSAGQIEQDPVGADRCFNRRLYRRTEYYFHTQIRALPRHLDFAHSDRPSGTLACGARHCQQKGSDMFGNGRHF